MRINGFKTSLILLATFTVSACNSSKPSEQELAARPAPVTTQSPCCEPPQEETHQERVERLFADRGGPPWYYKQPLPADLKAALADDLRFLGESNRGYTMMGDPATCRAFKKVGLPCDYNTRGTVATFLQVNGHDLFPPSGGTNPYCTDWNPERDGIPLCYIGRPIQSKMLREAVLRNQSLFKDGNLTAESVQRHWR